MSRTQLDPYAVLGVAPSANAKTIRAAYRALALKWHPDVNPAGGDRMREINQAFAMLSDPRQRRNQTHPSPADVNESEESPPRPPKTWRGTKPPRAQAIPCPRHPFADAAGACDRCHVRMCYMCMADAQSSTCIACQLTSLQFSLGLSSGLFVGVGVIGGVVLHSLLWGSGLAYLAASLPLGWRLWRWAATRAWGPQLHFSTPRSKRLAPRLIWWSLHAPLLAVLGMLTAPMVLFATVVKIGLLRSEPTR